MSAGFTLTAEPAKQLTGREERMLLQRAVSERDSPALRLKLAQLHNRLDEFSEAIALVDCPQNLADFATAKVLITALNGRAAQADRKRALQVAELAETLAENPEQRADALEEQAGALLRLDQVSAAETALESALALDPANDNAFRRLAGLWLKRNAADRVVALANDLTARGVLHTQLLGTKAEALALAGDVAGARDLIGVPQFLSQTVPSPPDEWPDLPAFLGALVRELMLSPGLRDGRHGTASVSSLRIDEPATAATPAMRALQRLIVDQVAQLAVAPPDLGHPWLQLRPVSAQMRMWCVITDGAGWERWHMHPAGWASGGYYVEVPESVQTGVDAAGCLEFGLADHRIGSSAASAFGSTLLRPQPGLLSLFPSHAFHRTHPHGSPGRRICIAFDLIPD